MKILLDTNVVLDFFLSREKFVKEAREIMLLVSKGEVHGFLCSTSITTIYYLMRKSFNEKECLENIKNLLGFFEITKVDKDILLQSIENSGSDFEDSVIYTSANDVDIIITRDKKGFRKCTKKVLTPEEFVARFC